MNTEILQNGLNALQQWEHDWLVEFHSKNGSKEPIQHPWPPPRGNRYGEIPRSKLS